MLNLLFAIVVAQVAFIVGTLCGAKVGTKGADNFIFLVMLPWSLIPVIYGVVHVREDS